MARTRDRKKQTRLSFTPLPSSSAAPDVPDSIRDRVANVTYSPSPSPAKRRKVEVSLPTPSSSSFNATKKLTRDFLPSSPSRRSGTSFMNGAAKAKRSPKLRRKMTPDNSDSENPSTLLDADDIDSGSDVITPRQTLHVVSISSDSSENELRKKGNDEDAEGDDDDDDDDDDLPVLRGRSRLQQGHTKASSDAETGDDADDILVKRPSTRKQTHKRATAESSDESDGSAAPATPRKLLRRRDGRPASSRNQQEMNDLEEDLEFLEPMSPETPRTLRGPVSSSKKTARQEALEAIKRRRSQQQGESSPIRTDHVATESDDEDESVPVDSDDHNALLYDDDDEDFIVDDNDDTIGEPVQLPFEFSRYQTMKPKELFKFAVEWMVQKQINPAFAMEDGVYRISFIRLNDFVKGLGGSKFQSSAWTPAFTTSLRTRPELEEQRITVGAWMRDRCDACNRSGHPATWEVRFTGKKYDMETLEHVSDGEDTDDDAAAEEAPIYYIGKFCMRNARTAHTLAHWRHHLNEWVIDYLRDEGYLTADKIKERDGWSTRSKREFANEIVDKMAEGGEIKRLHKDFRTGIDDAQTATQYGRRDYSSD